MPTVPPVILGSVSQGRTPGTSASSLSFSHTVVPGTDVLLIGVAYTTFFAIQKPTVTYGGVDVPALWNDNTTSNIKPAWFQLPFPAAGTANVVVSITPDIETSLAAGAINLGDFGGWRFGEGDMDNVAPYNQPTCDIYNSPTDLVIDLVAAYIVTGGISFTPDAGQTLLFAQTGVTDRWAKIAMSVGTPADSTTMAWTLSPTTDFCHFALAIKGLEALPAGLPGSIGAFSYSQTLSQQPTDTPGPTADWSWRHTIPSTHRTLAVLFGLFDGTFTPLTGATWTVDGGSPQALTLRPQDGFPLPSNANGELWYLENAAVGEGYIQAGFASRRWFLAEALSINVENGVADIIAVVARSSTSQTLDVPSQAGAIVVDLISVHAEPSQDFTAGADQIQVFVQKDYYNTSMGSGESNNGAGSIETAVGDLTTMDWTPDPATTTNQIGFSFLGVTPPPPECPGRRVGEQIGA